MKPKGRKPDRLTHLQQRFVDEYLATNPLNARIAAERAGYSPGVVKSQSARLLDVPKIADAVRAGMAARTERTKITADDVLRELYVLLTSDVRNYHVQDDGTLVLRDGVPDSAWRAVSSVKHKVRVTDDGETLREIEFRLWDKTAATKQLGEHLGMFLKKVEIDIPKGGGVLAVPVLQDVTQWAELAEQQQRALMRGHETPP